jgi:methionine-rich copper-binding protein CopC
MSARALRAALLVAAVALATAAAPALAHVELVKTSPKAGSTVKRTAASASATFSGPILSGTLTVTGPGGKRASVDSGARDPRSIKRVLVELRRGLKAGSYKATWKIVAGDGHRERGTFTFKLK